MFKRRNKDRAAKDVTTQEPAIRHPDQGAIDDREARPHLYWPAELERPVVYRRARPAIPCPKCDRVLTDLHSQAVVCDRGVSEINGKAYLTCRCCGHAFALPLERGLSAPPATTPPSKEIS